MMEDLLEEIMNNSIYKNNIKDKAWELKGKPKKVVIDKRKWHSDFGGHIFKIGEYLDIEWGLNVEYGDRLVGHYKSGIFLMKYYDEIMDRLDTERSFEDEIELCCLNMSTVEGCFPPSEEMRKKGVHWCYDGKKIAEKSEKRYEEYLEQLSTNKIISLLKDNDELIVAEYACEQVVDTAEEIYNDSMEIPKEFIDEKVKEFFDIEEEK